MKESPFHWHCDRCGWDSEHDNIKHSAMCFVLNPTALKSRPRRKTSEEEYQELFRSLS